ncbi:prepilin-type N-terminal cleavage/methylation domain-containing protein [Candidatus Pelagibacter sp.]|nr:prepilin-type N-terminal cleavage/methylation domain-containing protein [Candidatus Pelagibacter sp.]
MKNKISGFTLTETLIATVIGLISIVAAFSAYNYFNKSYASVTQKADISKSARLALTAIARDLRNAGYIDPNYVAHSPESNRTERTVRMNMLSVSQKRFGGKYGESDYLQLWYANASQQSRYITYYLRKYQGSNNNYYLSRSVLLNRHHPQGGNQLIDNELFVPYVEDFQVIFKDKEGKVLVPVCSSGCGSVEDSQGRGNLTTTAFGQMTLGQANAMKVHTAEVYLTVRSPKEVYSKARRVKIQNGESPHGSNFTIPADKYHRETFFVSVHTRNLATPQVKIASSGTSIGVGTGYNK